ncbi:MAG TPA: hypothetical protein VGM80_05895 [Gaiellaceae bacterium]
MQTPLRHLVRLSLGAACAAAALIAVGSAGALRPQEVVTITGAGFSPQVLRVQTRDEVTVWSNVDKVPHTVNFGTGGKGCSITIPAGSQVQGPCGTYGGCPTQIPFSVKGFQGTTGEVVVAPQYRAVTLIASSITVHKGQPVRLSGVVSYLNASPPSPAISQPVIIRGVHGSKLGGPVATVRSTGGFKSTWHAVLHPKTTTTYEVEVVAQPANGCAQWIPAKSRRVTITVR